MIQLADRMELVHSDIRGPLFREALAMQARGLDVLKLNTGNPAAFGFPLPESIRAAIEGQEARAEAEYGATQARQDIASKAKQLNLDAIHDTVHEIGRDEARHGKAFEGLLKRYFGK